MDESSDDMIVIGVQDISRKIKQLIEDFTNESDVKELDSFEYIQLVLSIEKEYDIEFDMEMLTLIAFQNNDELINYVADKVNEKKVSPPGYN